MALTKCTECGAAISERAPACPRCGCPAPTAAQVIEATGKRWKAYQLIGALAALAGIGTCVAAPEGLVQTMGILIVPFALILFLAGRLGAWWYHG